MIIFQIAEVPCHSPIDCETIGARQHNCLGKSKAKFLSRSFMINEFSTRFWTRSKLCTSKSRAINSKAVKLIYCLAPNHNAIQSAFSLFVMALATRALFSFLHVFALCKRISYIIFIFRTNLVKGEFLLAIENMSIGTSKIQHNETCKIELTTWLMQSEVQMSHSQGLSNNPYPEPNQRNSS